LDEPLAAEVDGELMPHAFTRRHILKSGVAFTAAAIAGSAAAPGRAGAELRTVTDREIQTLVEALDRERQAWIEGRFDPRSAGYLAQAPDMTIFGPFGGEAGSGSPDLEARQRRMSAMFRGGSGRCELVRSIVADDLLVLVMVERNHVIFEGRAEPRAWVLRTTQVFRRDGARWLRLHRHADPLLDRRSLDDTLALCKAS
jgi:hypothetical protein